MISHGKRWKYAFRAFFSLIFHGRIAPDILEAFVARMPQPIVAVPAPAPAPPRDEGDRAVQILSLLQRDGRLIDFLMEDLTAYPDAQVGSAVRDVHAGCRTALQKYITLAPILDDEEGRPVTVDRVADPARIKVIGNAGAPPIRGTLRHRGWEAAALNLPPLPGGAVRTIAPAEIEVA